MDLLFDVDQAGHLACTLIDRNETATVVAPNAVNAARELEAALSDACDTGYGECVWPLTDGEYKWLFRRASARTTVVVLWSSGTLTGWQHVFRSEADAGELEGCIRDELRRLALSGQ